MESVRTNLHPARWASVIVVLAGVWLILSPSIYGSYGATDAWNNWIAGSLIAISGVICITHPAVTSLSWVNAVLGIWVFVSPWIFAYGEAGNRFFNSLCVGLTVFCGAIIAANSERMSHDLTSTST